MAADDLAMQGARESATMIPSVMDRNNLVPARKGLKSKFHERLVH